MSTVHPLLRFAAAFLWADLELDAPEAAFLSTLAAELGSPGAEALLALPPLPEEIDPTEVPPALAMRVRQVALEAIAADGRVRAREMELFELLDELLPRTDDHQPS